MGIAVGPGGSDGGYLLHISTHVSTCLPHLHCLLAVSALIKSVGSLTSVDSVVPAMGHLTEYWFFLMSCPLSTHFICQKIRKIGLDCKALIFTASIIWFLTTFPLFSGNTFIPGRYPFVSRSLLVSLLRILLEPTMSRPKTAGERNESIMVEKAKKAMEKTKDPVEKLRFVWKKCMLKISQSCRCFCLSRGSTGILGLGRMFRRYCCSTSVKIWHSCLVSNIAIMIPYILSIYGSPPGSTMMVQSQFVTRNSRRGSTTQGWT